MVLYHWQKAKNAIHSKVYYHIVLSLCEGGWDELGMRMRIEKQMEMVDGWLEKTHNILFPFLHFHFMDGGLGFLDNNRNNNITTLCTQD